MEVLFVECMPRVPPHAGETLQRPDNAIDRMRHDEPVPYSSCTERCGYDRLVTLMAETAYGFAISLTT